MDTTQQTDLLTEPPKRTETLNILTILTFIGCGLAYLGGIYSLLTAGKYQEQLAQFEELKEQAGDNSFLLKTAESSMEIMKRTYEYRYIILISTLVFTTFCLIGAIQMRKLKKSGFTLYLIGELAPLVVSAILIGFSFLGGITMIVSAVFAIIFVLLYANQRKHLVY